MAIKNIGFGLNASLNATKAALLSNLNQFTISFWAYNFNNVANLESFISFIKDDFSGLINFFPTLGVLSFECPDGINASTISSNQDLSWRHYTIVSDITIPSPNHIKIYRDGVMSVMSVVNPKTDTPTAIYSSTSMVGILNLPLVNSPNVNTAIAEVGVWDRALSQREINHLAIDRYSPLIISDGLIMSWRFISEEVSEGVFHDTSPTMFPLDLSLNSDILDFGSHPDVIYEIPTVNLFSPHIISPVTSQDPYQTNALIFNRGIVNIEWTINEPPSDIIPTDSITYEIEYTDFYDGDNTIWRTLRRRIPWSTSIYEWHVGKMIKSKSVRIRIRSKTTFNESYSDWSMSDEFSINVFDLLPPAIVSPISNKTYTDTVLIILDETLVKDTYNQKVRYTLEYSSPKLETDWTIIVANAPVGQNVFRWNTSNLTPSDDYILRLTARNMSTSCKDGENITPDQISKQYIYNIRIQQSGMFLIDTKPPKGVISIENNKMNFTSSINQILKIYAEDSTTKVETMRLNESIANSLVPLGDLNKVKVNQEIDTGEGLLSDLFNSKEIAYTPKIAFALENMSGFKKIQALLKDTGGNVSVQDPIQVFVSFFIGESAIKDFIIAQEIRQSVTFSSTSATYENVIYEVIYLVTGNDYWRLDPYPGKIFTLNEQAIKVHQYGSWIYVFSHTTEESNGDILDVTKVYRDSGGIAESIGPTVGFTKRLSIVAAVANFNNCMFVGFMNGDLWYYNGVTWFFVMSFSESIESMSADDKFLYIGFNNSSNIVLYNLSGNIYTISLDTYNG